VCIEKGGGRSILIDFLKGLKNSILKKTAKGEMKRHEISYFREPWSGGKIVGVENG